jgi:hypothetical protein
MENNKPHIALEQHVIKTLLYFDIFNYPLKPDEVFHFLGVNSVSEKDVSQTLNRLTDQRYLFQIRNFYSIQNDESLLTRRLKGNQQAEKHLPMASRKAMLIAKFPFVRAVMASGSLSKNYMDEKSDLDFFVVTAPGRLWIARTLLVLYKRLILFNSHKYFCANYFIDEIHLEIEEKNQFTATELATLIPLYNGNVYLKLMEANAWMKDYFPNVKRRDASLAARPVPSYFKRVLEKILDISWLEKYFMNLSLKRWKRIYLNKYTKEDFRVAFKTNDHVSKNHPNQYQSKIMSLYVQKLNEFSAKHNISLQ